MIAAFTTAVRLLQMQSLQNHLTNFCCVLAVALDRVAELIGGYGVFYEANQSAWYDAWTEPDGTSTLRLGRWVFMKDGPRLSQFA